MDNPKLTPQAQQLALLLEDDKLFRNPTAVQSLLNVFADCRDDGEGGHARRCLNATVEVNAADLYHVSRTAIPNGYNIFHHGLIPEILVCLLTTRSSSDKIDADSVTFLNKNYTFRFGRESSPVLYIRTLHAFWFDTLLGVNKASNNDEFQITSSGELRIWWD